MLQKLSISNYALIDEIDIELNKGLNVITGETGAGKSILLGALGLILGKRADTSILFNPSAKCIVEGSFLLDRKKYESFFIQNDLDFEENSIIRREVSNNGKSRAFINDTPVTLLQLGELTDLMIDIHAQHQTLQLNNPDFQLNILDTAGGLDKMVSAYKYEYVKYRQLEKELKELEEVEKQSKADLDYYRYQYNEIEQLQLDVEKDTLLEEEFLTLSNAEKIRENLQQVLFFMDEEDKALLHTLRQIIRELQDISSYNPRLDAFLESIQSVEIELRELLPDIKSFTNEVDVDQQRIDIIQERLNEINRLLSKHNLRNIAELIQYAKETKEKLDKIDSLESDIEKLRNDLKALHNTLLNDAKQISQSRSKGTKEAENTLLKLLKSVGMEHAQICFSLSQQKDQLKANGIDDIDMLFSSNPGIGLQSVSKAASGGELSRLMLCIKYLLAGKLLLPTLIFDEIDLGISGEIAFRVGKLLSEMSSRHQIIAITHLPQVASFGQDHFRVFKTSAENKTNTYICKLNKDERIEELSKMIGGEKPSKVAVENAKELIKINLPG